MFKNITHHCGAHPPPRLRCLSPIILSPLNGYVNMSPHEQGDISIESERVAASGGSFIVFEGGSGVCQSRHATRSHTSACQASQSALSARRGGGDGSRQSRAA